MIVLTFVVAFLPFLQGNSYTDLQVKRAFLVKKHLKRLKKQEGAIKLVGGRAEFEGKTKGAKHTVLSKFVTFIVKD